MSLRKKALVIILSLACSAYFVDMLIPGFGMSSWALILGLTLANLFPPSNRTTHGIKFLEGHLLTAGIVLMGFNLDFVVFSQLGISGFTIIVSAVLLSIVCAFFIGRLFGLKKEQWLFLGFGNGICGSSAIAACAKLVEHEEEDLASSVGTINLLGSLGIFLVPAIIHLFDIELKQGAIIIGSSLQAVGHVIAAGYSLGDEAGNLATLVKMGRIALLLPALLILSCILKKNRQEASLPFMVWGFATSSCIASLDLLPIQFLEILGFSGKLAITAALAAIGYQISIKKFINSGSRVLIAGTILFLLHLGSIIAMVSLVFH